MFTTRLMLLSAIVVVIKANPNCDIGTIFYQELGCKPNENEKASCPKSYNCPKYELTPYTCRHLGVYYKDGQRINNTKWCNFGCFCSVNPDSGVGEFICPIIDCDFREPLPGCYKTNSALGKCCSDGIKCEPYGDIARCRSDNVTYLEGQIFSPKGTCWSCLCQKGYHGIPKEPFCIKRQCDMELRYSKQLVEKCAPIYRNRDDQCCPTSFLCPENVRRICVVGGNPRDGECKLGDHKVPVGGKFNAVAPYYSSQTNVTCACNVPPLPSCYPR